MKLCRGGVSPPVNGAPLLEGHRRRAGNAQRHRWSAGFWQSRARGLYRAGDEVAGVFAAAEQDTDDLDSPYPLIQRQFEDPDDQSCYIETHGHKYCGHFLLRRVDFTPQKLSIELDRPRNNFVSVTFAMVATQFAEASRVVKIISGEVEPP
jgi:hypothetical protein